MKNFRKIKERDLIKLRLGRKSFDNCFIDEGENSYIINYKNISYIAIQQKNKEDLFIEIYKFICNKNFCAIIYGDIDKKFYNSTTHTEKLLRRCKRIVFCDRNFYNEI